MEFNAQNISAYKHIIIYGGCSAEYLNSMYLKTKGVLKYTGIFLNKTDYSKLNNDLQSLTQYNKDTLSKLRDESVLIIIALQNSENIKRIVPYVKENGFAYDYISNYSSVIDISFLNDLGYNHYIDYCGNDITFKGEYKRNKLFILRGRENASNNKINIGDILFISNSLKVNLYGNNATVKIGNSCSFCEVLIQTTTDGIVEIGNSCMFSIPIGLFQVDGHHIFDLNTKERINKNKNIYIGNHVWVGRHVSILGGCTIPDNCIVGSNTVTSHKFTEKNCVIAGNPGKVIRKDVIWARDDQSLNYATLYECNDKVGLKYINY